MYCLKDKVILITGAARGIGAAISREVLKDGAKHLRILDVNDDAGTQLQNELNAKYGANKSKFIKCDVSNDEQFFGALTDTKHEQGYLDLLVNNAGVANESTYSAIRKQIEINLIAVVNGTLKAVELMEKSNGGRGGAVINVASIVGLAPLCPPQFSYCATKSAVLQFTSCIGTTQPDDIRIMAVCYGATDTDIFHSATTFERKGDRAAAAILTKHPKQSVESAARATIEAYQKGKGASVWLIHKNMPAIDITEHREIYHEKINKILA